MADLKNIVYLSNEDYETLVTTGTVTIGGDTLIYDEMNNVYVTPEETASSTNDGLMSAADKAKLDGIAPGAGVDTNQTVKVGSTTFGANDAVSLTGTGAASVTANATTKTINIDVSGASTSHVHPFTPSGSVTLTNTGSSGTTYVESISSTGASGTSTTRYLHKTTDTFLKGVKASGWANAAPHEHTHTVTATGNVTLSSSDEEGQIAYVSSVSGGGASGSGTTKYMHWLAGTTPKSGATPNHTSTNSGSNSGTKVIAVTGYPNFNGGGASGLTKYLHHTHTAASLGTASTGTVGISGGSGSLTSNDTSTDGIAFIASASHTAASLGTASKSNAAAEGHKHSYDKATGVDLGSNSTETGGVAYVESISSTGASGDYKYMHWSAGTTPKSGATPSHESKNTGTATTITSVTGKYLTISRTTGGTGTSARRTLTFTPAASSTTSGAAMNMAYVESGTSGTHTHTYDKTTSVSLTAGTAPSLVFNTTESGGEKYCTNVKNGTTSATTKYFHPTISTTSTSTSANDGTAVAAVTGYPNFSGGSASHTTKYLHHTHTAASLSGTKTFVTGYPDFNGGSGSLTSNTTSEGGIEYIESVSSTAASLGTPSTSDVAPNAHTHTYDKTTSVSLTSGTAPSLTFNGTASGGQAFLQDYTVAGNAVSATTKYLDASFSGTSATTSKNSGNAIAVVTGVTSNGTGSAITDITVNTSPASGDITYLQDYSVSGGGASATTKHLNATFDGDSGTTGTPQ